MFESAAAKIQSFFGLTDGEDYETYPQPQAPQQTTTNNSNVNHSTYQTETRADNAAERPATSTRYEQDVYPSRPQMSNPATSVPPENVRLPRKVVQMSKNKNRVQEDTAVEKTVKKVSILEPRTYTESKNIAKCIFRNEVVIVNFHLVEESQARRIVDFLTGAVYALDGDIQRLGAEIFICTPANTEIDSATAKSLLNSQFLDY